MDEKTVKKLLSSMQCGGCGQHCEPTDVDILGHQEDVWIISVYCPSCNSRGLVTVVIKEGEESEAASELTEVEKSGFSTPVSADDVIDMHIFLKDFDGDFSSLFAKR